MLRQPDAVRECTPLRSDLNYSQSGGTDQVSAPEMTGREGSLGGAVSEKLTGDYKPFEGVCMVDTFELAEGKQPSLFARENTVRVERQQKTPLKTSLDKAFWTKNFGLVSGKNSKDQTIYFCG